MQEMRWPGGGLTKEFFSEVEMTRGDMERSREQQERLGAQLNRVAYVKPVNRYEPHQGSKEIARRLRQMKPTVEEA